MQPESTTGESNQSGEVMPIVRPVLLVSPFEAFKNQAQRSGANFSDNLQLGLLSTAEIQYINKTKSPEEVQQIHHRLGQLTLPHGNVGLHGVEAAGVRIRSRGKSRHLLMDIKPTPILEDERQRILDAHRLDSQELEEKFSKFRWLIVCGALESGADLRNIDFPKMFTDDVRPKIVHLGELDNQNNQNKQ